jgi:diamine N-acetyltransferase
MIVGERIRLRAIEYEDLPMLVEWRNNPQVNRFFFEHEPLSLVMQREWFERSLQRKDEKFWIVETIDEAEPIGTVALVNIDWRNRKAEVGRVLIYPQEYRGSGYGIELMSLVLKFGFEHLNLNRLYCEVFADNRAALALYGRMGFREEGQFRKHIYRDGHYEDVIYLACLRDDYFKQC